VILRSRSKLFEFLKKKLKGKKCRRCGKTLWTGEICEDCLLEIVGSGLRKQLKKLRDQYRAEVL